MAGGGAGLLQLPMLIFLGLTFSTALSTHKIATIALGIGATIKHSRNKSITLRFSLFILAFGLPGVILGAKSIVYIPATIGEFLLGLLTLGIGLYSFSSKKLGSNKNITNLNIQKHLIGGIVLFLLGILNGSLTSGTGLFVTFWLAHWFKLPFKEAVAYTMILVGLFWNASGALTLALHVQAQWNWLPALLLGSLAGGYLGAYLSIRFGNTAIKKIFEIMTVTVGLVLITKSFIHVESRYSDSAQLITHFTLAGVT